MSAEAASSVGQEERDQGERGQGVRAAASARRVEQAALVLAPIAVAAAPIIRLWAINRAEFSPDAMTLPLVVAAAAAVALVGVYRVLVGQLAAASLLASLTVLFVLTFGYQIEALSAPLGEARARVAAGPLRLVESIGLIALVVALAWLVRRGRFSGAAAARALGIAALVLTALSLIMPPTPADAGGGVDGETLAGDPQGGRPAVLPRLADRTPGPRATPPLTRGDPEHPDVYYIIFDGYGRQDVLQHQYGWDNEPFLAELEGRGFYVARESYSNYPGTHFSLGSSLNMRYLDDELAVGTQRTVYFDLVRKSEVAARFRDLGYRYVLVASIWGGTNGSPIADDVLGLSARYGNEFQAGLLDLTVARDLVPGISVGDVHLAAFDALESVASMDAPTFTLAHIVLPHPPYVLDRDGQIINRASALRGTWNGDEAKRGYIEQLRFVNRRIVEIIDRIVERSDDAIIIIQGDHGPFANKLRNEGPVQAESARLAILNAYRVPGQIRSKLYPSISPVNSFRLLFAGLRGEDLELLPERHFYYVEGTERQQLEQIEPDFQP
jgi:hypothetical protein